MATPAAAIPRDLEQRFRDLEAKVRALTAASLRRRQLSVTEGDFVVSGGGKVSVAGPDGTSIDLIPAYASGDYEQLVFDCVPSTEGWGGGVIYASPARSSEDGSMTLAQLQITSPGPPGISPAMVTLMGAADKTATVYMYADLIHLAGPVQVDGDTLFQGVVKSPLIYSTTTSSAANVSVDGYGQMRRVSSSKRWKTNIRDVELDVDKALQLAPRSFTSTLDADKEDPEHVGFIAEEAADLGLDKWVPKDDDGSPASFDYPTWTVALQAICRAQQDRLDSQAALIADLSSRLDALEDKS